MVGRVGAAAARERQPAADGAHVDDPAAAPGAHPRKTSCLNRTARRLQQRTYVGFERRRIREATMSRMLTMPMSSRPSTTGRWRNPCFSITSRASSLAMSGAAVVGSLIIHAATGDVVRSEPEAAARSTSRSVRIPMSQEPAQLHTKPGADLVRQGGIAPSCVQLQPLPVDELHDPPPAMVSESTVGPPDRRSPGMPARGPIGPVAAGPPDPPVLGWARSC
jgi:hypothetical protein